MSMLLSLCIVNFRLFFFFFSSRRRHTRCSRDWSSDVCSSDLYQKAAGDWETNEKFPSGHRALTDRIHANGFRRVLFRSPFAVSQRSGVPAAHPDWLLRDTAAGPLAWDTREAWGGKLYALDGAHPKVQQWLTELARQVVRDWGYDYLEIDALHCATAGPAHYGGLTHPPAYPARLAALRDGPGTEAVLLGGGAPLQHAAGAVEGTPGARWAARRSSGTWRPRSCAATPSTPSPGRGTSVPARTPRTAPESSTRRRGKRSPCHSAGTRLGTRATAALRGIARASSYRTKATEREKDRRSISSSGGSTMRTTPSSTA